MDAQSNEEYFCEEGSWEGQVVEKIETVELNNDAQCNGSYQCCGYKANVPKPFAFNYLCIHEADIHIFRECTVL